MLTIDSPHNQRVKFFRSLHRPKGRSEQKAFLAEGARLIEEALAADWPLLAAAVCEELATGAARQVLHRLARGSWPCWPMSERAFRALSAEENPQGIAIACRQRLIDLEALELKGHDVAVAAWELRDPGNMGTLVRSAEFLGCRALVGVGDCVDFFDPKTVRATAGALFHLPLASATSAQVLDWARQCQVSLVAATAHGGLAPEEVTVEKPALLLVGSEAQGLPRKVERGADVCITLPRRGRVESLNAAVAAAICLSYLTG